MIKGEINDPASLLGELHEDRNKLHSRNVGANGLMTSYITELSGNFSRELAVWIIGNSIILRELTVRKGENGAGWHSQLTDVDVETGNWYRFSESNQGQDGGDWRNVFSADFCPETDGTQLKQMHYLLMDVGLQLSMLPGTIQREAPGAREHA